MIDIRHLCTKSSESMGVSSTVVGVAFCLGKCRCKNVLLCWRYFESPVRLILRERCSLTNNCVLGGNSSLDQTWNQLAMTSDNKTTTELSRWVFSRQYLTSATVWRFWDWYSGRENRPKHRPTSDNLICPFLYIFRRASFSVGRFSVVQLSLGIIIKTTGQWKI